MIDTATDALANSGVDEISGVEVTGWIKLYCEAPRRVGAGVLEVLDHIVKSGNSRGYAIGSRAKKAKAKVMYEIEGVKKFDPDSPPGLIKGLADQAGSLGQGHPEGARTEIGLDEEDRSKFIIRPGKEALNGKSKNRLRPQSANRRKTAKARDFVHAEKRVNVSKIRRHVGGDSTKTREMMEEMVDSPIWDVTEEVEGTRTYYVPEQREE